MSQVCDLYAWQPVKGEDWSASNTGCWSESCPSRALVWSSQLQPPGSRICWKSRQCRLDQSVWQHSQQAGSYWGDLIFGNMYFFQKTRTKKKSRRSSRAQNILTVKSIQLQWEWMELLRYVSYLKTRCLGQRLSHNPQLLCNASLHFDHFSDPHTHTQKFTELQSFKDHIGLRGYVPLQSHIYV